MHTKTLLFIFCTLSVFSLNAQVSFSEDLNNTFEAVDSGDQRFADYDGDGDQDIFVVGYADQFSAQALMHINDGNGNFTEKTTGIKAAGYAAVDMADVDNDGDIDLLISGQNSSSVFTELYLNDGNANFTVLENTPFPAMVHGSLKFADIDNDQDMDFIMLGINETLSQAITDVYINDGNANYELLVNDEITKVYQGALDFSDIDGDNDLDVFITGAHGVTFEPSSILYENDGTGIFTQISNSSFMGVRVSTVNFADIDSDGDSDLLLTGSGVGSFSNNLYENDGNGNFSLKTNTSLVEVLFGACSFADVDLDSDLDLLIVGRKGPIPDETAELYLNDGEGNFLLLEDAPFVGATGGGAQFGDVDGDNLPDIFITGSAPDGNSYSKLYINDFVVNTLEEVSNLSTVLYPNPCGEKITFEITETKNHLDVEIHNILGQLVYQKQFNDVNSIEISTDYLTPGIYKLSWMDQAGLKGNKGFIKK